MGKYLVVGHIFFGYHRGQSRRAVFEFQSWNCIVALFERDYL